MDIQEDEIDWETDFINGNIPYKQKDWITLIPLRLILQLEGGQLELTRGKSHCLWQDETPRIWSKETLFLCLHSLSIEVQSLGDIFILRREKEGTRWLGYYARRHIAIDQEDIKYLIKGNSIVI